MGINKTIPPPDPPDEFVLNYCQSYENSPRAIVKNANLDRSAFSNPFGVAAGLSEGGDVLVKDGTAKPTSE